MRLNHDLLLDPVTYALKRRALRHEQIAYRRERALAFGPGMRLQFEDERTLHYQVQEMLWAEGVLDAAGIQDQLAAYACLLPNGLDWRACLSIELPDARQRLRELPALSRAAHRFELAVGTERIDVFANEDLPDRHLDRPSAVHFLRFGLTRGMRRALRAGEGATLTCTHAAYRVSRELPATLLDRLCVDIDESLVRDNAPPPPPHWASLRAA